MERLADRFPLKKNVSTDEDWARAIAEIEHIVGSEAPLAVAAVQRDEDTSKRRRLTRPLYLSLLLASGIVGALALYSASPTGMEGGQSWQSARR